MQGEHFFREQPTRKPLGNLIDLPSDDETEVRSHGKVDVVGPPIFPVVAPPAERPAYRPSEADRETLSQQRAQEVVVAREIAMGRRAEDYWKQLCEEFSLRSAQCKEMEDFGIEMIRDRGILQKVRWEMNALIPRLAEARVRDDAARFSDRAGYARDLVVRYERAERLASMAEGDEDVLRSAIDDTRIIREQLAAIPRLATGPDGWRILRQDAIRKQQEVAAEGRSPKNASDRSVLVDLPRDAIEYEPWRIELVELRDERAKMGFFSNPFKKMDLDAKIAALAKREAYEARKRAPIAGSR